MKKFLSVLAAAVISAAFTVLPVSAAESIIDDQAGLYTESQLEELREKQQAVSDLTGWNIAVVTSGVGFGTDGATAMRYAEDYYDNTFGSDSSSEVYLIDLDYRHFAMDGDVLNYFNKSRLRDMMDDCEEEYFDYDDVGNLEKFYYHLERCYNKGTVEYDSSIGAKGEDFVPSMGYEKEFNFVILLSSVITGGIAAAIGIAIVLSRYKFHHSPTANCYLNSNTINVYRRQDRFVREYTTRTRIDTDSGGSGGGGGGHSFGGSSHGGGGSGGRR